MTQRHYASGSGRLCVCGMAHDEPVASAPLISADDAKIPQSQPDTVYVAMINDRHTDPEPHLFSTADLAIEFAKTKALEYARDPADVEEEPIDGWLYYARYSTEDDDVWVLAKTVDEGVDRDPA